MKGIGLNVCKQSRCELNFYTIISVPSNPYVLFKTASQKFAAP